jgi:hypothetical protein
MMTPRPSDAWRRGHRGPAALAAAYWTAGWDGMCAVVFGIAMVTIYWLAAERKRRTVLLDIYLNAPTDTEVIRDGGPAGLSLWVRVRDDDRRSASASVVPRPVTHPACGRLVRRRS